MMMRRRLLPAGIALSAALFAPLSASADIGITHLRPTSTSPGRTVEVEIGCGWPKDCPETIPVSLVPVAKAPQPSPCRVRGVNGLCTPIRNRPPRKPPYSFLGSASRSEASSSPPCGRRVASAGACYRLRFRVPKVRAGSYALVIYAADRHRGPGALITDTHSHKNLGIQPQRSSTEVRGGDLGIAWIIAAAGILAISATWIPLRRRLRPRAERSPGRR
jgi:hypothetical protein